MAHTHPCPYCHSPDTIPTLKEPERQYYLCNACRSAFGVFDNLPERARVTQADAKRRGERARSATTLEQPR